MAYLKDFRERLQNNDYPGFLKIWEEYCYGDQPDGVEMAAVLESVQSSELAKSFGLHVERILPLWRELKNPEEIHRTLRLILDLQTTNSEELADLATEYLKTKYEGDPLLNEKLRLVGLRNRERFQSAIRNFELITHFKKGNFVFHTAGWGTGEIIDVSFVREEVTIEFEYVIGAQYFSFEKAFKTLIPLSLKHFYSRRFGNPDQLEKEARETPSELIRLILRDLGPKTAGELKEEICDLIIPAEDWNRWWQTARARMKKDTKIEFPKDLKSPFILRAEEIPHEVLFHQALEENREVNATIQMIYTFLRDFPEILKNQEFKASLELRLNNFLQEELTENQKIQILFFLDDLGSKNLSQEISDFIAHLHNPAETIRSIEVLPFQKRALQQIRKLRSEWSEIFLELLFTIEQNLLRDFLLSEFDSPETQDALKQKLNSLLIHPLSFPELFVWYFQKILDKKSKLPFSDPEGQNRFFESLLILLDHIEQKPQYRDLSKKIISSLTAGRYKVVRDIFKQSTLEETKEYLLLATKCNILTDHDIKILHSLGEVVHPSLARLRKAKDKNVHADEDVIWTTAEGYQKIQVRIQQIATVETVHNAREIEAARALGDLRENAEFKAALERRSRLQSELKLLSDQIAKARILTPEDVPADEVGIGSVVHCRDSKGEHLRFILLGPWDADPEKHILSFQSKLAQAMRGRVVGEKFEFQGEKFAIADIDNYFDQNKENHVF
ncbi:MAG TPA: GreA/GreB family elongation factor [Chlamydiales bacterium]|nr:GreA/GreB family elongation factor [Chlamydiales bacterium]